MFATLSIEFMSLFHEHRSFLPSYWLASYLSQLVLHRFLHHKRYIKKRYILYLLVYILCSFLVCDLTEMQIVELIDRYDTICGPMTDKVGYIQDSKINKSCTRTLTVSMTAKVRSI